MNRDSGYISTIAESANQRIEIITGEGSVKSSIRKRPQRKFISQMLVLALIDIAKERNDLDMIQPYWNTYHCQNRLTTYEGKAYGHFCKNRWCIVCNSIRKANLINKYKPIVQQWQEPHFLTLTVKSQKHTNLDNWLKGCIKAKKLILERCRKRYLKGKGPKLIGIKSLECNFNPIKKTYNPHYHIICASKDIAETIKYEWCATWNRNHNLALPYLQHIRKVRHLEKDVIETIKYGAKIFIDPTMKKFKDKNVNPVLYAAALHEIYKAMKDHRMFGTFGFILPRKTTSSKGSRVVTDFQNWSYDFKLKDWVNEETGQVLTNYLPDNCIEQILNSINSEIR